MVADEVKKKIPIKEGLFKPPSNGDQGYLVGNKCKACGEYFHPKRVVCANCYSEDLEDIALSRGVPVRRVKTALFFATSLMVGGIVSVCGPIGFIGMMAPHICRLLIGYDHRYLAPATCVFGGAFLVVCDAVARLLIPPAEIPVGVITALLGGPFFLWLLLRRSREGGPLGDL